MFSIIIPVYNVEQYLKKCITSVLEQTYRDFEVILVDDGSTDSSGSLCDSFQKQDSRIHVFHKNNEGLSSARSVGIAKANGDYIIFLDSDDYWLESGFLNSVDSRLAKTKADVLCFNFCKVTNGQVMQPYFPRQSMPLNLEDYQAFDYFIDRSLWVNSAWNKVIMSSLLKTNGIFFEEGVTSEDIEWSAKLVFYSHKIDFIGLPALAYVQRAGSISRTMNAEKICILKNNVKKAATYAEKATGKKRELLCGYVAYQTGILLFNLALADNALLKRQHYHDIIPLLNYLPASNNRKLKLLNAAYHMFGYEGIMHLLKFSRKFFYKES